VLGASTCTGVEATRTQALPDRIGAHVRMPGVFGGVPEQAVPDNLKAGVTKACLHEPRIERPRAEMAAQDDTVALPARPCKPRERAIGGAIGSSPMADAKVQVGVLLVQRRIIARLPGGGSSRCRRCMPRSGSFCPALTARSRAIRAPAGRRCSSSCTGRRRSRCRPFRSSMPTGSGAASGSIAMSGSSGAIIRSRTGC
jgi:hypothetical protein